LSERWVSAGAMCLFALFPACLAFGQGKAPPKPPDPPQFLSVSSPPAEAPLYSVVEIQIDLKAAFENPFDPTQVSLDAEVNPPTGQAFQIPGFYFQSYNAAGAPEGPPGWRLRI